MILFFLPYGYSKSPSLRKISQAYIKDSPPQISLRQSNESYSFAQLSPYAERNKLRRWHLSPVWLCTAINSGYSLRNASSITICIHNYMRNFLFCQESSAVSILWRQVRYGVCLCFSHVESEKMPLWDIPIAAKIVELLFFSCFYLLFLVCDTPAAKQIHRQYNRA